MTIKLNDINDINCFFKGCEFYEGIVNVSQENYVVNGKSLMGLYSLNLSEPIDVTIQTSNKNSEIDFYNFLRKWAESDKREVIT